MNIKGNIDLKKSLIKVKELGFSRVFLESGIKLATSFFEENLVDNFKLFLSNKNLGKNGDGSIKNYFYLFLKNKPRVKEKVNLLGDKLITYNIK